MVVGRLEDRLTSGGYHIGPVTVAFCFYLVIIVQSLTNYAQNIRLAKSNQTVQLVFYFVNI